MPDRGALVVSLDLELAWGYHDLPPDPGVRRRCAGTRRAVRRLLGLFARYEVPATWAVVGHLFLSEAPRDAQGRAHPDHPRPRAVGPGDWFSALPPGDARSQPLWFAPDLIPLLREAHPRQEIGSHSFSHVVFDESHCDADLARAELSRCAALARKLGLELRSFVFPRNVVGHLPCLREAGFEVFRGPEPTFYGRLPPLLRKPLHITDRALAWAPRAVRPRRTVEGLIDLPGSMQYLPAFGWRRAIPVSRRVAQARKGLEEAVQKRAVFHLWLHPEAMADPEEPLFAGLEVILEQAKGLRRGRKLDLVTLHDAATGYLEST